MKKDKLFFDRHDNQLGINDVVQHYNPEKNDVIFYLVERIDHEHMTLSHKGKRIYLSSIIQNDYQKEGNIKSDPELVREVIDLDDNLPHKAILKVYHVEISHHSGQKIIEKVMASNPEDALDKAMPKSFIIIKES